jgi:hypothetical protein
MLEYQWDSKVPMPFAALLNGDSELIRATIADVSLPAQATPLLQIGDEARMALRKLPDWSSTGCSRPSSRR